MSSPPIQSSSPAQPVHDPARLAPLVERLGARWSADACGAQAVFPEADPVRLAGGFAAPLPDLGVLEVSGADAVTFLHAQLTNDVEHLGSGEARWFGYCSPKGRLLSTFLGWGAEDGVALTVARPQAEALRKRLSMYVLRAKARVVDRSDAVVLFGLGGDAVPAALAEIGLDAPAAMSVARHDGLAVTGLPPVADVLVPGPLPRWLLAVPAERVDTVWSVLAARLCPASSTLWRRTEVRSGIPRIVAGAVERFVPQMINFELVGGVNFKKGCYPGQEVVARSQYLGKLKRRMFLARLAGPAPAPGADVVPADGGEPIGEVVLSAEAPGGAAEVLFEARTEAVPGSRPCVDGAPLEVLALPYEVPVS